MPFARHGTLARDAWCGRLTCFGFGVGLRRAGFVFGVAAVVGVVRATEVVTAVVDPAGCCADDLCPEQAASADAPAVTARAAAPRSRMRRVRLTACLV
jgi:hypothetical protein